MTFREVAIYKAPHFSEKGSHRAEKSTELTIADNGKSESYFDIARTLPEQDTSPLRLHTNTCAMRTHNFVPQFVSFHRQVHVYLPRDEDSCLHLILDPT